ncbi:MAG: tetratricopeptide repeat protein [Cyanobacteria bacterium J06639_18]
MTPKDYYTRGNDRRDIKSIQNSTKIINNPKTSNLKRKNAYINRGVVYFRHKKYQEAIADYSKVIKDHNSQTDIAPTNSQLINAYVNRGIVYSSLQEPKHQLAVKDYNQAIAIKPDYADAYINRGIAYSGLGQYEMAVKDYIKAISITPENADIYYAKAHTQSLMEGKIKRAMYNYQRAADLYKKQGKSSYSKNALQKIEELKASMDT